MKFIATIAVLLVASAPAIAAAPAPLAAAAHATGQVLPKGTVLAVTPVRPITSRRMRVGDRVRFQVMQNVYRNDVAVLRRGTPVTGVVSWRARRNFFGKRAKFDVTFQTISVGGREWRLAGRARQVSDGNVGAIGDVFVSRPPHAVMRPGQVFTVATADDIRLP